MAGEFGIPFADRAERKFHPAGLSAVRGSERIQATGGNAGRCIRPGYGCLLFRIHDVLARVQGSDVRKRVLKAGFCRRFAAITKQNGASTPENKGKSSFVWTWHILRGADFPDLPAGLGMWPAEAGFGDLSFRSHVGFSICMAGRAGRFGNADGMKAN
jgi:hypothetical protein